MPSCRFPCLLPGALAAALLPLCAAADEAPVDPSPIAALASGHPLLQMRARYESVEQDGKTENANAMTLRTLFGYATGSWHGLSATVQGINVGHLGEQNYNDTLNGRTQLPTVADPDFTGLNQAYLQYDAIPDTTVRLGKQAITVDNQRFLGNADFRQVMQVYSALDVVNRSVSGLELSAAYIWRMQTVFAQQQQLRTELLHADWSWQPANHLVAYALVINAPKTPTTTGLVNSASQTAGLRADGAWPLAERWKGLYTAEAAHQEPVDGGDGRIGATYEHAGLGTAFDGYSLRGDFERKGSNNGTYGFQTPLATNHLFQGWTDQFLSTPAQGIRDTYASLAAPLPWLTASAEYHRLKSDFGGLTYGHELDAALTAPLPWCKGLRAKAEYGDFHEEDPLTPATARKRDIRKVWLTLVYNLP